MRPREPISCAFISLSLAFSNCLPKNFKLVPMPNAFASISGCPCVIRSRNANNLCAVFFLNFLNDADDESDDDDDRDGK